MKNHSFFYAVLCVFCLASCGQNDGHIDSEDITYTIPAPRQIMASVTVETSVEDVYTLWTTIEGQEAIFGGDVIMDLRAGGLHEVHFLPEAEPGQRGHENGIIVGFQENKFLSFTWTMPPYMPLIRDHHTYVYVQFEDLNNGKARISLFHSGFGQGRAWDEGYEYFEDVWPVVLEGMKAHLELTQ